MPLLHGDKHACGLLYLSIPFWMTFTLFEGLRQVRDLNLNCKLRVFFVSILV